jgi:hypothetical protein
MSKNYYECDKHSIKWKRTSALMKHQAFKILLHGFSKFSILIGWQAVRKNPYAARGPYFPYVDPVSRMSFIWREIFALQTEKNFAF